MSIHSSDHKYTRNINIKSIATSLISVLTEVQNDEFYGNDNNMESVKSMLLSMRELIYRSRAEMVGEQMTYVKIKTINEKQVRDHIGGRIHNHDYNNNRIKHDWLPRPNVKSWRSRPVEVIKAETPKITTLEDSKIELDEDGLKELEVLETKVIGKTLEEEVSTMCDIMDSTNVGILFNFKTLKSAGVYYSDEIMRRLKSKVTSNDFGYERCEYYNDKLEFLKDVMLKAEAKFEVKREKILAVFEKKQREKRKANLESQIKDINDSIVDVDLER